MLVCSTTLLLGLLSTNVNAGFVNQRNSKRDNHVARDNMAGTVDAAPNGEYTSPLVLPGKNVSGDGTANGDWSAAVQKAKNFVAQLTVPEMVNLTTGSGVLNSCVGQTGEITRLGFKGICLQDSPLGVRFGDYSSLFPAGITVASTWDKNLLRIRGEAMGYEHRGKGVNIQLGPMMNMQRAPAAGRIWEGFGGDPYLTGVCSVETIQGIQSQGVVACAKHYVGNEQEHYRGGSGGTASSSNIGDRTMHEIYTWPFAESVKAGVGSVMCSYNRINQTYGCQNSKILNGILKEEFNFQGFVVSDWGAVESGVNTIIGGTDMNMPGFFAYGLQNQDNPALSNNSYFGLNLVQAVANGSVPLWRLQDMSTRIMAAYYKMGQDDPNYPPVNFNQLTEDSYSNGKEVNQHVDVQADHAKLIREIGSAGTVLLKNVNNTLPLDVNAWRHWGIFGSDATQNPDGPNSCVDRGCNSGTLACGWGSGTANFPYLIDPFSALQNYIRNASPRAVIEGVFNDFNRVQQQAVARQSDMCMVFVNSDSGEGYITVAGNAGDRNNLTLWHSGDDTISNVTSQCSNTVVVVHSVGPVDMEAWIENPNVTAVLWAHLPGQESGNSIVDVIFGDVNPSARLPYTIGKLRTDYAADVLYTSNLKVPQITYSEELLIDYRWFDAKNITPRYEFGFGLSYTSFDYSYLNIKSSSSEPLLTVNVDTGVSVNLKKRASMNQDPIALYDEVYRIKFNVKNVGGADGYEVSQMYLGFPAGAGEPPKVLRGFERTWLKEGQTKIITLSINKKEISIWDVVSQCWIIPTGKFSIFIGKSSRNIVLTGSFTP